MSSIFKVNRREPLDCCLLSRRNVDRNLVPLLDIYCDVLMFVCFKFARYLTYIETLIKLISTFRIQISNLYDNRIIILQVLYDN